MSAVGCGGEKRSVGNHGKGGDAAATSNLKAEAMQHRPLSAVCRVSAGRGLVAPAQAEHHNSTAFPY